MQDKEKCILSQVRYEHALECLQSAKALVELGQFKSAANRIYYAAFHAMRAVLSLDGIDMKHHSGVISEFRRLYIKEGIFETKISGIISDLFNIRTDSDYDDFYIISKSAVTQHLSNAEYFVEVVSKYLKSQWQQQEI